MAETIVPTSDHASQTAFGLERALLVSIVVHHLTDEVVKPFPLFPVHQPQYTGLMCLAPRAQAPAVRHWSICMCSAARLLHESILHSELYATAKTFVGFV